MPTLQEIFEHELKDLYSAEGQLAAALPKMQKASATGSLADAFKTHLQQTKEHQKRLEEAGKLLGVSLKGETCLAMKGLVEEGQSIIEDFDESLPRDAALIAAAQRIEHYEIAAYGSAVAMAQALGHEELVTILESTLAEEKETDVLLTDICVGEVIPNSLAEEGKAADQNQSGPTRQKAAEDDEYEEDEDEDEDEYEDDEEDDEDENSKAKSARSAGSKKSGKTSAAKSSSSKSGSASSANSKSGNGKSSNSGSGSAKSSAAKSSNGKSGNGKSAGPDLDSMTKEELYQMAQEQDLEGRSSMSKDELVKALS